MTRRSDCQPGQVVNDLDGGCKPFDLRSDVENANALRRVS